MSFRNRSIALAVSLVLASSAAQAQTQPPSAQDQAAAEGLFNDAKKLVADGKFADACPKFEESQRLDPAPGTQFNLAECYEHVGRTASAWALFLGVASLAKSAGMADREKIARERAAALEPTLAKLVIAVPSPAPDIEVKRDGVVVGRGQWGASVAVDPGSHAITASAPGKQTWNGTVDLTPQGATVTVPALTALEITPSAGAASPATADGGSTQKTLALVAAGVGVVGVGLGSVFGLNAISKLDDAKSHCTGNACDSAGVGLRDDAVSAGTISTIAFTVGVIALVGAGVLWLTAPSSPSSEKAAGRRVPEAVGFGRGGMILGGAF